MDPVIRCALPEDSGFIARNILAAQRGHLPRGWFDIALVALQMAIRHPGIAAQLILADCGAAFSEEGRQAFRNMAAASQAKGLRGSSLCRITPYCWPPLQTSESHFGRRQQLSQI
jgi:hypothetical protein